MTFSTPSSASVPYRAAPAAPGCHCTCATPRRSSPSTDAGSATSMPSMKIFTPGPPSPPRPRTLARRSAPPPRSHAVNPGSAVRRISPIDVAPLASRLSPTSVTTRAPAPARTPSRETAAFSASACTRCTGSGWTGRGASPRSSGWGIGARMSSWSRTIMRRSVPARITARAARASKTSHATDTNRRGSCSSLYDRRQPARSATCRTASASGTRTRRHPPRGSAETAGRQRSGRATGGTTGCITSGTTDASAPGTATAASEPPSPATSASTNDGITASARSASTRAPWGGTVRQWWWPARRPSPRATPRRT